MPNGGKIIIKHVEIAGNSPIMAGDLDRESPTAIACHRAGDSRALKECQEHWRCVIAPMGRQAGVTFRDEGSRAKRDTREGGVGAILRPRQAETALSWLGIQEIGMASIASAIESLADVEVRLAVFI